MGGWNQSTAERDSWQRLMRRSGSRCRCESNRQYPSGSGAVVEDPNGDARYALWQWSMPNGLIEDARGTEDLNALTQTRFENSFILVRPRRTHHEPDTVSYRDWSGT